MVDHLKPGTEPSPGITSQSDMNRAINLTQAVEQFAFATLHLTDAELEVEWQWRAYNEGVRYAFFRTYEELRTLAARLAVERSANGAAISHTHRALAQYHLAYRDLQAILLGLPDDILDVEPAKGEWSLRIILGHILAAEREFFARIWFTINKSRQGITEPTLMPTEEVEEFVGSYQDFERTMNRLSIAGVLAFYDSLHKRVLRELTDIRAAELEAETLWWEEIPISVEFRLHRLDAHLRQHSIQIEKTLAAQGYVPNEAKQLLRLIYTALGEVDSMMIGDWGIGRSQRYELAATIQQRAKEISNLFANA